MVPTAITRPRQFRIASTTAALPNPLAVQLQLREIFCFTGRKAEADVERDACQLNALALQTRQHHH